MSNEDVSLVEKISNFAESIWIGGHSSQKDKNYTDSATPGTSKSAGRDVRHVERTGNSQESYRRRSMVSPDPDNDDVTDQLLFQAEKFKAKIEAPKGNFNNFTELLMPYDYKKMRDRFIKPEGGLAPIDREILFLRNFDQDNEFFHIATQRQNLGWKG